MAYLTVENFYKSFGETEVLKGIDFSLNKGEVLSIIGSSGSGKTTLLRCINFLEQADKGTMSVDGQVLFDAQVNKKDNDKVLREKRLNFGLVFQSFNLFPQYNVLDNIALAPRLLLKDKIKNYKKELKKQKDLSRKYIRNKIAEFKKTELENIKNYKKELKKQNKFSRKDIRNKIAEFKKTELENIKNESLILLEKIGLTEKINSYPCELSGGQCQRVAIARALALKPKILCFDEPTSALDPELTGEVLKVIRSLKDDGRTMIIVTHEMAFAKNVSDKVIFMADGVIEEAGKAKDIFEKPKSEKLIHFLSSVSNKDGE